VTARFAALEARANRAVFSHLGNVNATLAGLPVVGIFDAAYQLQDMASGVMSSAPVLTLSSADVPPNVVGASVVVGAVTYKVVEPMPDGAGITMLRLRT
jgi:hypothetical protein